MLVIKHGIVEDYEEAFLPEVWLRLDAHAPVPHGRSVIIPFARYLAEQKSLLGHQAGLGVDVPADAEAVMLARHFHRLELIAVALYCNARETALALGRQLRRLGFTGELRATEVTRPEHYALALAAGFDSVQLAQGVEDLQVDPQWRAAAEAYISASLSRSC